MISHISLGISDVERSMRFYDAVMDAIGVKRVWTHEKGLGYGRNSDQEKLNLFLKSKSDRPLAAGPGFHLAFEAPDRLSVDKFYEEAVALGGKCDGKPGPRPKYSDTYYAAFVFDPDGHKIEIVHQ
jgi:catechol 2,3-dioxygenase-like lactoylglutathione lyase family enzyme